MQTCTYRIECTKIKSSKGAIIKIKYVLLVNFILVILYLVYFALGFLYRNTGMYRASQSYFSPFESLVIIDVTYIYSITRLFKIVS